MRRFIIILSLLFTIILITISVIVSGYNTYTQTSLFHVYNGIDTTGLTLVDTRFESCRVEKDSYSRTRTTHRASIQISTYFLEVKDGNSFLSGQIFSVADKIILSDDSEYEFSSRSRVKSIYGNMVEFENFDEAIVTLRIAYTNKILGLEQSTYSAKINKKDYSMSVMDYSFDISSSRYTIHLKLLDCDMEIFTNQVIEITMISNQYVSGLYISSDFIFYDDDKAYVHKKITLNNEIYYKVVPIQILDVQGDYAIIESEDLIFHNVVIR